MSRPPPPTCKTWNWPSYNQALKRRGSLTIRFDPAMTWEAAPSGKRGRPSDYSDAAIQTCLTMKVLFGMALRQTTGFVESLLRLTGSSTTLLREETRGTEGGRRRDHLRSLAQRVEVADDATRIMGSKPDPPSTLIAGQVRQSAPAGVPRRVPEWQRGRDCGPTFSGHEGSLLGFLPEELEGLFILTGEAAHPYRGQQVEICRIVSRVVGQRDVGQWPEGNVDEGEIGFAEGVGVQNTNEFWQGVAPRVVHRQQDDWGATKIRFRKLEWGRVGRAVSFKLVFFLQFGFFIEQGNRKVDVITR